MAQYQRKDKEQKEEPKRHKKAQPVYDRLKQAGEPDDIHGDQAEAILELQQTHGNRYVQRLAEENGGATLDEDIIRRIEAQRASGRPMESETRSEMEAAFNQDFGDVRIHTDANADRLSKELGARAFTTGKDIFFRADAYELGSKAGKELVTHELAHVVQQEESTQAVGMISKAGDALEQDAAWTGLLVGEGREVSVEVASAVPILQRQAVAESPAAEAVAPELPTLSEEESKREFKRVKRIAENYLKEWERGSRDGVDTYCSEILESKKSLTKAYVGLGSLLAIGGLIIIAVACPPAAVAAGVIMGAAGVGAGYLAGTHGQSIDEIVKYFREHFNKLIDDVADRWEAEITDTLILEKVLPDLRRMEALEVEVFAKYFFPVKGREYYKKEMIRQMQAHYRQLERE